MGIFSLEEASNLKGNEVRVVLEGPRDILIKQLLQFKFTAINEQEECKALITRMILTKEMDTSNSQVRSNSQLVADKITGKY